LLCFSFSLPQDGNNNNNKLSLLLFFVSDRAEGAKLKIFRVSIANEKENTTKTHGAPNNTQVQVVRPERN
jgi:hypothetical protein